MILAPRQAVVVVAEGRRRRRRTARALFRQRFPPPPLLRPPQIHPLHPQRRPQTGCPTRKQALPSIDRAPAKRFDRSSAPIDGCCFASDRIRNPGPFVFGMGTDSILSSALRAVSV